MIAGPQRDERVVIPVNGINRAVVQAVNFGRSIADDGAVNVANTRGRSTTERGMPLWPPASPARRRWNASAA